MILKNKNLNIKILALVVAAIILFPINMRTNAQGVTAPGAGMPGTGLPSTQSTWVASSTAASAPFIPGLDATLLSIYGILYITTYIFGSILLFVSGSLVDYAINPNHLSPFSDSLRPGISSGWLVLKNFANIIIIFFILFEAIKIVLRIGERSSIKSIFMIIAVAVLVNFSFLASGLIWDVSTVTSLFFFQGMTGLNPTDPGASLSGIFMPKGMVSNILGDFNSGYKLIEGSTLPQLAAIGLLFVKALMFLVMFVVFFALFILLFIRVVVIAFLLMLAPIAWLGFGISSFKSWWSKWWDHFARWAFFAPAVLFFLFISMSIVTKAGQTGGLWTELQSYIDSSSGVNKATSATSNTSGRDQTTQFFSLILSMGFLVGSLIAANSTGIGVSGAIAAGGQKAGSWAVGKVAKSRPMAGLRGLMEKQGKEWAAKGGVRGIIGRQLYKAGAYKPKAVEEEERMIKDRLNKEGPDALAAFNDRQRQIGVQMIAKDDKLRAKLKEDQKDLIVRVLPQIDPKARATIEATMPHWAVPRGAGAANYDKFVDTIKNSDGKVNLEEFYKNADPQDSNTFNAALLRNPQLFRIVASRASGRNKISFVENLDKTMGFLKKQFENANPRMTAEANRKEFSQFLEQKGYKAAKTYLKYANVVPAAEAEAPGPAPSPAPGPTQPAAT